MGPCFTPVEVERGECCGAESFASTGECRQRIGSVFIKTQAGWRAQGWERVEDWGEYEERRWQRHKTRKRRGVFHYL